MNYVYMKINAINNNNSNNNCELDIDCINNRITVKLISFLIEIIIMITDSSET